jgi:hypothetical protein
MKEMAFPSVTAEHWLFPTVQMPVEVEGRGGALYTEISKSLNT